jgi:homoserine dehydrogenase
VSERPLRVAVAGLGTVGAASVALLKANADAVSLRAGRSISVVAVSARDATRDRGFDRAGILWFDDPVAMAAGADADVVVEAIGGASGVAPSTIAAAIAAGRHVVTANKALLAVDGLALAAAAERRGVALAVEAAVAGGIPVIKTLREGLAGNRIDRVAGILNGTCNFILSTMRATGRDFAPVLEEAQRLGYAEADPAFDVDGVDAAHKLCLLASIAFAVAPKFADVRIEGIRHVSALDIAYAEQLGYRIKLLGLARLGPDGLEQRVQPCMVPVTTPIAGVEGVFNAVALSGDAAGRSFLEGRGAGGGPTASAVVADLIDLARGHRLPAFGVPADRLSSVATVPEASAPGAFSIRLTVVDRPGVIADVTAALRDFQVSLEAMIQRGRDPGGRVPVVLTTHETTEGALRGALGRIAGLDSVVEPPRVIRILQEL